MAIFTKFNGFVAAMANGVHNLSTNQITVALTSIEPLPTNEVLVDLSQISYTNMSSRNITTTSSLQTDGVYKLILADITLTQNITTSASFRYIALYNSTAVSGNLIGYYDYGSSTLLNIGETLLIDFDQVNGVLRNT